jgi:hypothetical protein
MSDTITIRATRDDVKKIVAEFVAALAGRGGNYSGVVRGLQLRLGTVLLSQVQADFDRKANGGTGLDGIKWQPLSPRTIANRRFGKGEKAALNKAAGVRDKGGARPLLTPKIDKLWRQTFTRTKASLMARGLDEAAAGRRAGAAAWVAAKGAGGKTKLMVYGGRQVEILVDTGELRRSFTPGADGNILRLESGSITVGTNKKPWHHLGTSRGLPARPFWPVDGKIPDAWWGPILEEAKAGVLQAFVQIASGRAA